MVNKSNNCEHLHAYGVHFPTRTILLTGVVSADMYTMLSKNLMLLDRGGNTIVIHLFSEGGDVTAARAIYRRIRECKDHVRIVVYGEASSSASIILQAADERIMTPESILMLHLGEEEISDSHPRNLDRIVAFNRKTEEWMKNIYLQRIKNKKPRFTKSKLDDILMFDSYFTADQALEYGLIDRKEEV